MASLGRPGRGRPLYVSGLSMRSMPWLHIQPGDVGFDGGRGFFGWIIRRATGVYGHTWIYHELLSSGENQVELWKTVEAGPRGIKEQIRSRPPVKVARLWNTPKQQAAVLAASQECVGLKYGWGEIFRLALRTMGLKVNGWKDNPNRMICSNHVAHSITKGVSPLDVTLPYPPHHIWPQRLAEWCDWVKWTQARAKEKKGKS
jgi:hypothetical protein